MLKIENVSVINSKETQIFKVYSTEVWKYCFTIKVSHTKMSKTYGLLNKYYLFLPISLFIATCDSFSFLSRDVFQFLDVVLCKVLNVTGDHLCHCIKNCVYNTFNLHNFICSMRESLCKSLDLFQVQT